MLKSSWVLLAAIGLAANLGFGDASVGARGILTAMRDGATGRADAIGADLQPAAASATFSCVTGMCVTLTYPITNVGRACATNVQVVTRAYGSDGDGPQLGFDIPMGVRSGSLAALVLRPGTTLTVQSIAPFDDVRSASTVMRPTIRWTDVPCE
jgi:hypothetical protein